MKKIVRTWIGRKIVTGMIAVCCVANLLLPVTEVHAVTDAEHKAAIKGIDVSQFNGDVDFDKVKEQGYTYVMVRCGSGESFVDPNFATNYGNAGKAGLKRGVYYYNYATSVEGALKEAERCISILDQRNLECPVAYDIEEDATFETGKDNVTAMTVAFCERIKEAGYTPMVYASLNKLNEYFDYDTISQYKIWVANYDVDYPNYAYPYMMWQYKIGSVKGANTGSGECDVNYIYEDFIQADSLNISQNEMGLELGEGLISEGDLAADIGPDTATNKHINWRSEDESVATVDANGHVVAVANGTTSIIASSVNGVEAECSVTVTTPATAITFDTDSVDIGKKETISLNPVLTPETSTDATHYKSSDEKIVKVEEDGSITGVNKGTATITATTDSGVTTKIKVTVKKKPWRISTGGIYKKMKVGDSFKLKIKLPKNSASNQIEYYSRNQYRVSVSETGKVEALQPGWCLIKAQTYNGKKSWKLIHVVE